MRALKILTDYLVQSLQKTIFICVLSETFTTPHGENSKEHKFIETIRDCFFFQQVREPTRKRGDDRPSQLDLVFTDEDMQVSDIKYLSPLGKSDHSMIVFDFHCYVDYKKPKTSYKYAIYSRLRGNSKRYFMDMVA